ncbi:MAG: hypothetical protein AAGG01_05530 [Planctomycetota bacterium]
MEDLIETDPGGGLPRFAASVATALVLLTLAGTATIDAVFPSVPVPLLGAEAEDMKRLISTASFGDGSLARNHELNLRLRSRTRQAVAPFWSVLLMKVFRCVPEEVALGDDGWLFLRRRVLPPQATRARSLRVHAAASAAIQRRLGQLGSEVVMMPIPRKVVACSERLRKGLQTDRTFDQELMDALSARGVETLSVIDVMATLSPEERYLRQDTHWAYPTVRALARRIAEASPDLVTKNLTIKLDEHPTVARAGLLQHAAVGAYHQAASWLRRDASARVVVQPRATRTALEEGPVDVDVAVVGTSFTKNYQLAECVAFELGQLVYPGGVVGQPFAGSLANFAKRFRGLPFPRRVFFETPVHQAFQLGRGDPKSSHSLCDFFRATSESPVQPVPLASLSPPRLSGGQSKGARVTFPAGALLSSGDGILQLRLKVDTAEEAHWQLRGQGTRQVWTQAAGERTILLPVLHEHDSSSYPVTLAAMNDGAGRALIEVEVMVDAKLDAGTRVPLELTADSDHRASGLRQTVGRSDSAIVTWSGQPKVVAIVLRGTTPDGEERRIRARFSAPKSRLAALSLAPLRGGILEDVRVLTEASTVSALIAPAAR